MSIKVLHEHVLLLRCDKCAGTARIPNYFDESTPRRFIRTRLKAVGAAAAAEHEKSCRGGNKIITLDGGGGIQ